MSPKLTIFSWSVQELLTGGSCAADRTTALTDFSNLGRGSKRTLPHFKHLIRKSTPVRMTSHRSPPQGWVFLVLTTSPTVYLGTDNPWFLKHTQTCLKCCVYHSSTRLVDVYHRIRLPGRRLSPLFRAGLPLVQGERTARKKILPAPKVL